MGLNRITILGSKSLRINRQKCRILFIVFLQVSGLTEPRALASGLAMRRFMVAEKG